MIKTLKPFIVGHFDLIRIFDDHYQKRIEIPQIQQKIIRNLELIKSLDLVMDFNLRPLVKGKKEPYIASTILERVKKMGIRAVPGDDSHGVDEAGCYVDTAIKTLKQYGFDTLWPEPRLF
jgi:histidinol-phosphatase (PHP family)